MPSEPLSLESQSQNVRRLRETIRLEPANAFAHAELARVFLDEGQVDLAEHHAGRAAELAPASDELAIALASLLHAIGKTDQAWNIADRLIETGNETPALGLLRARMALHRNHEADALVLIDRLMKLGESWSPRERSPLQFAASQLLDALGRYDEAFALASAANAGRGVRYDGGPTERLIRDFSGYFTRPTLRSLPRATHGDETPVFIVGMPRSGTTLMEQILASHPKVHGAGEIDWIHRAWQSAVDLHSEAGSPLSHCLDRLSARDADELADAYLLPLHALNPAAERIINKSPSNFMHLGLIEILFPMARVIHCRRDALDTCVSCYMTDFAVGNDFSYALETTGHFYRHYDRIMSHWREVLNLPVLEVNYEEVVADLPRQTRRMLKFLDLPWDDACLRFHENKRLVTTASSSQVRQPIYQSSVGRWRNYDRHLSPLRIELGKV